MQNFQIYDKPASPDPGLLGASKDDGDAGVDRVRVELVRPAADIVREFLQAPITIRIEVSERSVKIFGSIPV